MIRSIRLTLTLWYIGILAVILCFFGWALYTNVAANLAQDVNEMLASQAEGVANSLSEFWQAEHAATADAVNPASSRVMRDDLDEARLSELTARWTQEAGKSEIARPIRLLDRKGRPVYTSRSFTQLAPPLTKAAVGRGWWGRTSYETLQATDHRLRLITHPVVVNGHMLYLVQVAAILKQADISLSRLRVFLVWLIPLTVVVTSAVGWLLATGALRPVGRMTTQVRQMGAGHLRERVDVPRTGDELERLAATFNEMLERLERAFHRLRQFSAAASHELRTPLTIMKGELEVALRKPRTPEEYQQVLRTHLEILNEMAQTVEELLMLARTEAIEGVVEWRPVEIVALAEQARHALQPIADARQVRVEVSSHEPIWVRGERRLLERLLANLLDNAIRHTPSQGRVTVHSERRGNGACLIVQDTGPGIPAEELPQLFDRFFSRRSEADGGRPGGLGLGLCRWIAEVHHGRIEVASPPDQGATFTVWLPLSTSPS